VGETVAAVTRSCLEMGGAHSLFKGNMLELLFRDGVTATIHHPPSDYCLSEASIYELGWRSRRRVLHGAIELLFCRFARGGLTPGFASSIREKKARSRSRRLRESFYGSSTHLKKGRNTDSGPELTAGLNARPCIFGALWLR
jgi:hypothetical protein